MGIFQEYRNIVQKFDQFSNFWNYWEKKLFENVYLIIKLFFIWFFFLHVIRCGFCDPIVRDAKEKSASAQIEISWMGLPNTNSATYRNEAKRQRRERFMRRTGLKVLLFCESSVSIQNDLAIRRPRLTINHDEIQWSGVANCCFVNLFGARFTCQTW